MQRYFLISAFFILFYSCLSLARADDITFIVNENNPATSISRAELVDYFFKKKRKWPDGTSVRFLDRKNDSLVRKVFLSEYLNKSSEDVELFWIGQKLYSGDSAPLKESSDSMALQFVKSFKGAISFVPEQAAFDAEGIKIIQVR
ncbi:MAG: hypothetical protein A2622_07210 [Bdellovibrionales bacterium RIFCSPHIGHO2_01_FULL_40_29]|nr:MAG: hypothetical protein A2622_07210 [Bdellovibrionales bacterium RIFCSPHIGHO2_01_FULL_40_29]OFZ33263.1 MAG: hypothetical protein A3D17_12230 [Bdellovibrionales bacterium RIFCSPHIGHO2_02_FULL_40_15]